MACYCGTPSCAGFIGVRSDEATTAAAIPSGRWVTPTAEERASGACGGEVAGGPRAGS